LGDWELIAVLPNLQLDKAIENEFLALVPRADERLKPLATKPAVVALLDGFTDAFRRPVRPSALILRTGSPSSVAHDAVVAFRNVVAIPTIAYGWASVLGGGQVNPPIWSDTFSFYPVVAGKDGHLVASTPAFGMIDTTEDFAGQASPLLARNICGPVFDHAVYDALAESWKSRYIAQSQDPSTARLFRSLQTAFAACTVPYDNLASLGDFGVRVGLWVSAFEILAHPGSGVDLQTVVKMLNNYQSSSSRLNARGNIAWRGRQLNGNVPAQLYAQLNEVRNHFVHGNELGDNVIYVARDRLKPLWNSVAPLLYWCALRSHLWISAPDDTTANRVREHLDRYSLDHALQAIF
jgi:hypothetical protein